MYVCMYVVYLHTPDKNSLKIIALALMHHTLVGRLRLRTSKEEKKRTQLPHSRYSVIYHKS